MEIDTVVSDLLSLKASNDWGTSIGDAAKRIAEDIRQVKFKIIDLVKGLNQILTNSSYSIRSRGVELIAQVVTALPKNHLMEKEIEVLSEFICLRLIDHKSMEDAALRSLLYFVDCDHKPMKYNNKVMEFIKNKANIHKMEAKSRHKVYELLKKFVIEKKRMTNSMNGEFIYSLVTILEGENNPDNLMLCFGMIAFILKNFDDLEPYIDDIFEWLSSYYPVDYTPIIDREKGSDETAAFTIHRSDLVEALYECFYATDLNADNLQTLLLEKVDSNILSSQLESLECLIKCYEKPLPLVNITKFNSTLWTAIRMNCLKKMDIVEPKLLDASLRTLTALAKRLLQDKEVYMTFITDMYEELAIAFRKPEMELFEPAARLLTHSILPSPVGFDSVLNKILPISLNALEANELRPLPGLAYIFNKFHFAHPNAKLSSTLDQNINRLAVSLANLTKTQQKPECITLLEALLRQRVNLSPESLSIIVEVLKSQYENSSLDIEKCLALVCSKYDQFKIISDSDINSCDLNSLLRLIYHFDVGSIDLNKFSIYLRLLKLELVSSKGSDLDILDQMVLNDAMLKLRALLTEVDARVDIIEKSAFIHAAVLNKLNDKNANQICMSIFSSNYCQDLIPKVVSSEHLRITSKVYLPVLKWAFKSLVLRNHQLATPLINLILNCVTSEKVAPELAYEAAKIFEFVLRDDEMLENGNHFNIFTLFKQKFYVQTSKEIRLRLEQQQKTSGNDTTKRLLIFAIASQLTHLPLVIFKRDSEWLLRHLLFLLSKLTSDLTVQNKDDIGRDEMSCNLLQEIYKCLECLIRKDLCHDALVNFLPSIIDVNLKNAQQVSSVRIRQEALVCLARVATSFKESDLIVYRANTIDRLRTCLTDKKRLVRQAAGEARLRWVLVGQPIGPSQ